MLQLILNFSTFENFYFSTLYASNESYKLHSYITGALPKKKKKNARAWLVINQPFLKKNSDKLHSTQQFSNRIIK